MIQEIRSGAGRARISAQHQFERRGRAQEFGQERGRWAHVRLFGERACGQGRRMKSAGHGRLRRGARKTTAANIGGARTHARRRQRSRHRARARYRRRDHDRRLRAEAGRRQRGRRHIARRRSATGQGGEELVGDAGDFSRHRREIEGGGCGRSRSARGERFDRSYSTTWITCTHGSCRHPRSAAEQSRRGPAPRPSSTATPGTRPRRGR